MTPTRPNPRPARVTWRSLLDHGAVAAAFLMILWFLTAGLLPDRNGTFETASAGDAKLAAPPVTAKAP